MHGHGIIVGPLKAALPVWPRPTRQGL